MLHEPTHGSWSTVSSLRRSPLSTLRKQFFQLQISQAAFSQFYLHLFPWLLLLWLVSRLFSSLLPLAFTSLVCCPFSSFAILNLVFILFFSSLAFFSFSFSSTATLYGDDDATSLLLHGSMPISYHVECFLGCCVTQRSFSQTQFVGQNFINRSL